MKRTSAQRTVSKVSLPIWTLPCGFDADEGVFMRRALVMDFSVSLRTDSGNGLGGPRSR